MLPERNTPVLQQIGKVAGNDDPILLAGPPPPTWFDEV